MKHVSIRVTGKVQGVFFRATAQEKAQEWGIAGFVRNEPDGSVFIEAQGKDDALERFIAWCREGPEAAAVESVAIEEEPVRSLSGFRIER